MKKNKIVEITFTDDEWEEFMEKILKKHKDGELNLPGINLPEQGGLNRIFKTLIWMALND